MKVLALISGGKDSCYNIMKCISEGHEMVALANLYPPASADCADLDSYMYQSVGSDAIEVMAAECWGLPLYRAPIGGKPVNLESEYAPTEGDEVEDLFELVKQVLEKHPDIQAISSGAIWSSYQKVRVENVCARLGLTSLAYLWAREQSGLLQEMIDAGLDASDLGKTLVQAQPKLMDVAARWGINVCGEGGEFESLVLDCPLYRRRLVIDEHETIVHRDNHDAPVVLWRILKCHSEPKL